MGFFDRLFRGDPERAKLERRKKELSELKETLRSEEIKLNLALRDLEELKRLEDELLEKGKSETSEISKRTVAFKIKDVREKQRGLESRIAIYDNRIKVLREQINSLETLVEAGSGGLPREQEIEQASFEASQKLEELNNLMSKIDTTRPLERNAPKEDEEIGNIMKEFDKRADRELKKAEMESLEKREKKPKNEIEFKDEE